MISKAKSKFIKSLQIKKYRKQEQCFVVEGSKSVAELIRSDYETILLLATAEFLSAVGTSLPGALDVIEVTSSELSGLGEFQTNDGALAVARMKPAIAVVPEKDEWLLAVDDIRDPGNLGTIIRTADWYGIRKIVASEQTAEFYNPKVIHASMGSFLRVDMYYTSLSVYLDASAVPVVGAFLDGEDIHGVDFGESGILVIGNESHGISPAVASRVGIRVTIPRFGAAESLNAGIATAVVLDNIRRAQKKR